MAVIVITEKPDALLQKIHKAIEENTIDTWIIDSDGDFTHIPEQWNCKAWMHLADTDSNDNKLVFGIVGNKKVQMTKSLYAVYHGRFSEMLLSHFDTEISEIKITSKRTKYDFFL